MRRAHVIGAGLAGLSAAVRLAERGWKVTVSEAATQAGGRCRSYLDPQLGLTIDNGNHLVLSGNHAVHDYLNTIDAADRLDGPEDARFPFMDLSDGTRWTLHPNAGPIPWWVFAKKRRVPGTKVRDYLPLKRLIGAPDDAEVRDRMPVTGTVWRRLFEPFLVAALNTQAEIGSAALAGAVVGETLAKGGRACRPRIATPSLAAAFVDPALAWLERHGATIRLGRRVRALGIEGGRVTTLTFAEGIEPVGANGVVILATPSWGAAELLPSLTVPDRHHSIVNAHFRVTPPAGADPIVGLVGGTAEWVFAFPDRVSTTTSAADRLDGTDREELARTIWGEVARVHGLKGPMPAWQIVREKRATFSATPEQDAKRPAADATGLANLLLAGDWTRTGLPATIEGAIRSGATAAKMAAQHVPA
ncbi:hydroxysqualene dehydroxylase HpnE [Sphingomonas nostoxanthinifaciens]|uniref:hydroxysqualene dehydroxylase HpnE n=1 Tax=Sphingomonas nostoxanthinifaciens TaxID=2872652 RepID=UPI001CC1D5AD|nr:hydroxysqualene dehydroxylase HpnE [Sphingomonas nostoxanthinifaciens]UAK23498.1 hydroxysqualene dehydroxylase HpnE [Sphingomonas nostoxanthinifaciens]